jgi:hypothetical protein
VDLRIQQMTSSVQLVEALGGGWDYTLLPTKHDVGAKDPPAAPVPQRDGPTGPTPTNMPTAPVGQQQQPAPHRNP